MNWLIEFLNYKNEKVLVCIYTKSLEGAFVLADKILGLSNGELTSVQGINLIRE